MLLSAVVTAVIRSCITNPKATAAMNWYLSHRADKRALPIADRHYNRQKPGTPQFVPPGRCCVMLTENADALWVTSWPFAEYVKHEWAGAWVNSCFRNEGRPAIQRDITVQEVAERRKIRLKIRLSNLMEFEKEETCQTDYRKR